MEELLNLLQQSVRQMQTDCEAITLNYAAENRMEKDITAAAAPRPALLKPEELS
jgi:hypothetical protein